MSTSCKVCLAGKYQDSTSATSCKVCVAGQYAGSIQATTCSACDSGDYQDTTGQSSCKSCLAGTYSTLSSASISCTDCARGRAQGIAGQGSCLLWYVLGRVYSPRAMIWSMRTSSDTITSPGTLCPAPPASTRTTQAQRPAWIVPPRRFQTTNARGAMTRLSDAARRRATTRLGAG